MKSKSIVPEGLFDVSLEDSCDVHDLVRVHQAAFPGFYLTLMGAAFLHGYYNSVLSYPNRIVFSACQDGVVIGFVVGFCNPDAFYAHFRSGRAKLVPAIALGLLRHPWLIVRTLKNSKRVQQVHRGAEEVELSSIGVLPSTRGVGSSLLRAFVDRAGQVGAQRVVLTTDVVGNDLVNAFYVKHGFVLHRVFDDGGRAMNEYHLSTLLER